MIKRLTLRAKQHPLKIAELRQELQSHLQGHFDEDKNVLRKKDKKGRK